MKYLDMVRTIALASGICVILLLSATDCCRIATPETPNTPSRKTPSPSRTSRPTPPPCCVDRGFPPICGIIPGQSTTEDVESALGDPAAVATVGPGTNLPAGMNVNTRWYPPGCPLYVFFADEVVSGVDYNFSQRKTLRQVVDRYGPPEGVQVFMLNEAGLYPVGFIWPAEGIVIEAALTESIEDPYEAPLFQASLRVSSVYYFEPTAMEEVISTYSCCDAVLIDWPGMTD
jgi:hypothetical protein